MFVRTFLIITTILVLTCGDKHLIPDLSFKLSGHNVAFPCPSTKKIFQNSGRYVPKNIIGTRLQISGSDAIVALPRYKQGVPFTLGKFSLKTRGCKGTLEPFPCWAIQEEGNCEALQSVVDIILDPMDVLWVLDVGIANTLEQPVYRCPPKIVGISTKTGQVLKTIDLMPFVTGASRLQYLLVDYVADGRAFAFVSDAGLGAIVVYDVFGGKGFRVVLPSAVLPQKKDVLYMAVTRKATGNNVIFTYLSSQKLFTIKETHLITGQASGTIAEIGTKPQPIVILGTDNGASVFFRYKGESDIFIWNTETQFNPKNFVLVQKGDRYRLSTQVVPGYKKLMWALESNFHDYVAGTTGGMGASMSVHPLIKAVEN